MSSAAGRILSAVALVLAIAAWPLTIYKWPGLLAAIGVLVLAVIHGLHFRSSRVMKTALIIAAIYLLIWLLYFIGMAVYRSILSLGGDDLKAH
ncbi:MAG: hypothetical protein VZQ80_00955 [Lachnospiraceae bacterium]|nr:hypothetical protein [Lachnospiraceae bacterium]